MREATERAGKTREKCVLAVPSKEKIEAIVPERMATVTMDAKMPRPEGIAWGHVIHVDA